MTLVLPSAPHSRCWMYQLAIAAAYKCETFRPSARLNFGSIFFFSLASWLQVKKDDDKDDMVTYSTVKIP